MNFDLYQFRYFIAACEHGSFRRAARALNVQESAVSRRVRDLEHRLGTVLFYRSSSGVTLTPTGRNLFVRAKPAFTQLSDVVATIALEERGVLRIGVPAPLGAGFLSTLLQKFEASYPRPVLVEGHVAEHIASVRSRRLDVAFIVGTIDCGTCKVTPLWTERVFVALPEGHAVAAKPEIHPVDLQKLRLLVSREEPGIHNLFTQSAVEPIEIERCDVGCLTVMTKVALDRGFALVSEAMTAVSVPNIVYRPLAGPTGTIRYNAVWRREHDKPALRWLLGTAQRMLRAETDPAKQPTA